VVCRDAVFHRASWLFDSNFEVVLIFNSVIPKQKLIRRAFAAEHVLISTCFDCRREHHWLKKDSGCPGARTELVALLEILLCWGSTKS